MDPEHQDDDTAYSVVVNHEEQYSLWPSHREVPLGWTATGRSGCKDECLAFIETAWSDMRPLTLRRQLEAVRRDDVPGGPPLTEASSSLVARLATGRHPVEAASPPEGSATPLDEAVACRYVPIRFTDTRGGTLFRLRLDKAASRLLSVDLNQGTRAVHLEGELTLNRTRVRCVVDLDTTTLRGEGHLVPIPDPSPRSSSGERA